MVTFPKFLSATIDSERQRSRPLQVQDCAPGNLVYAPGRGDTNLNLVVRTGANPDNRSLIAFTSDGPVYVVPFYDDPVILLEQRAVFVIDQTSRQISEQRLQSGAIRVSDKGACLFVRNGQHQDVVAFDLDTFANCSVGTGIQFTRWSIEVSDDIRRTVLFEFSV